MRIMYCPLAMLLLATLLIVGCATRHPTATNTLGSVSGRIEAPSGVVTQITRETLESLDLEILTFRTDDERGLVLARSDGGRQVQVDVRAEGERNSQIWVRVGAFGDTQASVSILNRIKRRAEGR